MLNPVTRIEPLPNARHANNSVLLEVAPLASRITLRALPKGATTFAKSLGFDLPTNPKTSTSKGSVHALWIGPDEWMIFDESDAEKSFVPKLPNPDFSAIDISHRNMAIAVSGPGAENAINSGCPQNLSLATFPIGACSRTVFGKAEVVLYRTGEKEFRVECWRSFSPYVWGYLCDAAKDAAA